MRKKRLWTAPHRALYWSVLVRWPKTMVFLKSDWSFLPWLWKLWCEWHCRTLGFRVFRPQDRPIFLLHLFYLQLTLGSPCAFPSYPGIMEKVEFWNQSVGIRQNTGPRIYLNVSQFTFFPRPTLTIICRYKLIAIIIQFNFERILPTPNNIDNGVNVEADGSPWSNHFRFVVFTEVI